MSNFPPPRKSKYGKFEIIDYLAYFEHEGTFSASFAELLEQDNDSQANRLPDRIKIRLLNFYLPRQTLALADYSRKDVMNTLLDDFDMVAAKFKDAKEASEIPKEEWYTHRRALVVQIALGILHRMLNREEGVDVPNSSTDIEVPKDFNIDVYCANVEALFAKCDSAGKLRTKGGKGRKGMKIKGTAAEGGLYASDLADLLDISVMPSAAAAAAAPSPRGPVTRNNKKTSVRGHGKGDSKAASAPGRGRSQLQQQQRDLDSVSSDSTSGSDSDEEGGGKGGKIAIADAGKICSLLQRRSLTSFKGRLHAFYIRLEDAVLPIPLDIGVYSPGVPTSAARSAISRKDWEQEDRESRGPYASKASSSSSSSSSKLAAAAAIATAAAATSAPADPISTVRALKKSPLKKRGKPFTTSSSPPPLQHHRHHDDHPASPDPAVADHYDDDDHHHHHHHSKSNSKSTAAPGSAQAVGAAVVDFNKKYKPHGANDPINDAMGIHAHHRGAQHNASRSAASTRANSRVVAATAVPDNLSAAVHGEAHKPSRTKGAVDSAGSGDEDEDEDENEDEQAKAHDIIITRLKSSRDKASKQPLGPAAFPATLRGTTKAENNNSRKRKHALPAADNDDGDSDFDDDIDDDDDDGFDEENHNSKRERNSKGQKKRQIFPGETKTRMRWSYEEEEAFIEAVGKYGPGNWRSILEDPEYGVALHGRTNVNLKDKFRNLQVQGRV